MKYHPYSACDEPTEMHVFVVFGDALFLLRLQALRLRCCVRLCCHFSATIKPCCFYVQDALHVRVYRWIKVSVYKSKLETELRKPINKCTRGETD